MAEAIKPLGELLVSKGFITEIQLRQALEEQRTTKEFLGTLLMRKGWLRKQDFLQTFAEQMSLPLVHLDASRVDWAVAKKFSPTAIIEHHSLPIAMDRSSLTVAVVNPLDVWGVEAIERQAGGRKIRLVLVSEEDFAATVAHYRKAPR